MHRRIAGSQLTIYPNSGHGAIFQYHREFAPAAIQFLDADQRRPSPPGGVEDERAGNGGGSRM